MAHHLGSKPENLEGKNFRDFLDKKNKKKLEQYIEKTKSKNTPLSAKSYIETSFTTKEKDKKHIQVSISKTYISKKLYFAGIVKDVTTEKELQEKLAVQQKEKEKLKADYEKEQALNELKTRFVSMASHEFRSPLAGMLSSVNLMERYIGSDTDNWQNFKYHTHIEKHINVLKKAIKNLSDTFDDFLSIGKISERKIEIHKSRFNIKTYFANHKDYIVKLFSPEQHLNYKLNLQDKEIYLDKNFLNNILNNLISNAIKYSPAESEIQIVAQTTTNNLNIKVIDQGKGIPKTQQQFIYDHFFRADNVENYNGTGLGLTVTNEYVKLLNGNIKVESEKNNGTTFIIDLPL
jgi:PAS domain S-box-containing protein